MYSPLTWLWCAMQYANALIFDWDQFFAKVNLSWRRLICVWDATEVAWCQFAGGILQAMEWDLGRDAPYRAERLSA